jgi:hypothetical protein
MKKKIEDKKNVSQDDDNAFELELYQSLKSYGYLFPENIRDVEKFETLYGNTEIETPDTIDLSKEKDFPGLQVLRNIDFGFPANIAAFTSNEDESFNMPGNLLDAADDPSESDSKE